RRGPIKYRGIMGARSRLFVAVMTATDAANGFMASGRTFARDGSLVSNPVRRSRKRQKCASHGPSIAVGVTPASAFWGRPSHEHTTAHGAAREYCGTAKHRRRTARPSTNGAHHGRRLRGTRLRGTA